MKTPALRSDRPGFRKVERNTGTFVLANLSTFRSTIWTRYSTATRDSVLSAGLRLTGGRGRAWPRSVPVPNACEIAHPTYGRLSFSAGRSLGDCGRGALWPKVENSTCPRYNTEVNKISGCNAKNMSSTLVLKCRTKPKRQILPIFNEFEIQHLGLALDYTAPLAKETWISFHWILIFYE